MSLYQCDICGCCENTALAAQGFDKWPDLFDWSYAPEREGKRLCSACGPVQYSDGKPTKFGKWHDQFERVFLLLGMFVTSCRGNLAHHETCDEDFRKYRIEEPA